MQPKPEQFGSQPGKIKSKQVTGVAEYPTLTLIPCQFTEGVGWYNPPPLLLCVGVAYEMSGSISFAPVIVPPMEMTQFRVWINIDAFDEHAKFLPKLLYYDKDEKPHQQVARSPITGDVDRFLFDIPIRHVDKNGWFTCSLFVDLLTPLEGNLRRIKMDQGQENPSHPMILRGAWVEIQGQ